MEPRIEFWNPPLSGCAVDEVMDLMVQGSQQRSVAATLMNEESSRSHSILTATIDTREHAPNGDTTLRSSRLHLVDLAGTKITHCPFPALAIQLHS